ncbi:RHS repeat-associated core domain-containing protein [Chryseobacterium sp. SN22]|uniref:DUF6443 domain-containing protein n=1 Tax=Chryseobacterium sp. SN22 TaxID=2606431 RepID=UPI0011EBACD0|nr:DUF6443 domain-containing protein [Chryseobacterium sp. SN22]KAA0128366.1 RHS repeat-associated core domain-containing protein [Chryseobacterium sp. SN22]
MKKYIIPIGTILLSGFTHAQLTVTENYVRSRTYLEPVTTSSPTAKQTETVQYFDGLGRPKQVVNVKASPLGKDVVTPIIYDAFGRQTRDYLPVPQQGTNSGAIYSQQPSGYFPIGDPTGVYTNEKPFSEKILENSPLDRILQQKQVGMAWDTKPVQFGYDANTTQDAVKKYTTATTWVDGATSSVLSQSINYAAEQLYKNTVTDEDGNVSIEFKNGEGQLILVRKMISDTEKADTYYVYNEYDQLAFVISPKAAQEADPNTVLGDLCYQYRYDGRGRTVEKKIPGKGWEYMVYDKQDRLILSQDTLLKTTTTNAFGKKGWLFTKYDRFGRVVYTGFFSNTASRPVLQNSVNSMAANAGNNEAGSTTPFTLNGMDVYYTKNAFPTGSMTILSVSYYDSYPPGAPARPSQILGQEVMSQDAQNSDVSTKSLPVASYVKNIEDDSWTKNYIVYDKRGRTIGTHSINHLGGYTKTETELDFAGAVKRTHTYHLRKQGEVGVTLQERFVYDGQNRLLQHYHKVDNQTEVLLAENTYNELSQLSNKKVGNNLQSIDYAYNIRGWMTGINPDQMPVADLGGKLFSYRIKYNEKEGISNPNSLQFPGKEVAAKYNGNIAEVDWRSVENIGNYPSLTPKRYGYAYDKLNRLTAGFYQTPNNPGVGENTESLDYDLNGNITRLFRTSVLEYGNTTPTKIDDLEYIYGAQNKSNKLITINDNSYNATGYEGGGMEIKYDVNGNMTEMPDKGINKIRYNYLNLPNNVNYSKSGSESVIVNTKYSAGGGKLQKENTTTVFGINGSTTTRKVTDYLDGFQYLSTVSSSSSGGGGSELMMMANSESGRAMERQAYSFDDSSSSDRSPVLTKNQNLQFFPTAEGFYDYAKNQYIYQYKDHLGNVRISFGRDSSGNLELVDVNDYYPFGMNHLKSGNSFFGVSSYKNYKYNGKELQETGMYDYGARMYMADVGRWGVVDPLAETSRRWSTYNYAFNNPILFIDPDGREAQFSGTSAQQAFKNYISQMPPDDYIDTNGKYLGSDGAATKNTRIIYGTDWNNITSEKGGSLSSEATASLQASSSIITINENQISLDINNANNETIEDQTKERQLYLGLKVKRGDIPTAEVTSVRGLDGTDGHADFLVGERVDPKTRDVIRLVTSTTMLLLGGAHTHNLAKAPMKNIPGTSDDDIEVARGFNTTNYSIDSYTGRQVGGNAMHRRTSNGVSTLNVGTTINQNIGKDALNIFINKQKP